uniref:Uncharacterized protein n=1 Tax=viral metagenome TaxID=1070528 RepID=A0A6C0CZC0_9ZZZZ
MIYITNNTCTQHNIVKETYDIYTFFYINNVISYSFDESTYDTINIHITESRDLDNTNKLYFILEYNYPSRDAFAHWVYESAIYLELFIILKKRYNNLKLLLQTRHNFKKLFCNFFNISDDDIIYEIDTNNTNKCIFPSPISSLHLKNIDTIDIYREQINRFKNYILKFMNNVKNIEYTIMPRQSKENYKGNDRNYSFTDIINLFQNITSKTYHILNTDYIENLHTQISIVSSSKNVILSDGSALLVNNLFTHNSNILIIDKFTQNQAANYPKMSLLLKYISEINGNTLIYFNNDVEICNYLQTVI